MEFTENTFCTNNLIDLNRFCNFLERYDVIILKKEIKTTNGSTLVQAERPLTEKIIKNLIARNDIENGHYIINNTDNLKNAIINKIFKELNKNLELATFSFPAVMIQKKSLDIRRIIRSALTNTFFYGYITLLFYANKPITIHLIEVTLICIGLLNSFNDEEINNNDFQKIFQAGFLHDYCHNDLNDWFEHENFETPDNHDRESALAISNKSLSADISDIILMNNKLSINEKYNSGSKQKWYENTSELLTTILNLTEYYIYLKNNNISNLPEKIDDYLQNALFQLSLLTEKNYFPNNLLRIFEMHYKKYSEIFNYGKIIGATESLCIYKNLAFAYPKPKATQLLCINSSLSCEYRIPSQPLKVVQDTKYKYQIYPILQPGWYYKCKFSSNLPKPLENL